VLLGRSRKTANGNGGKERKGNGNAEIEGRERKGNGREM